MKPRKNILRRNRFTRRGVMIALVGFMLVFLVGTVAFVADLGNVIVVKTTLGAAADAAALAGAGAMAQSYQLYDVTPVAVAYGRQNVPENYGDVLDASSVTYGVWDPATHSFTPTNLDPNAIRVRVERTHARKPGALFLCQSIWLGLDRGQGTGHRRWRKQHIHPIERGTRVVYVTSTKELSNVVLNFGPDEDGNPRQQKFEPLTGYTGNFRRHWRL